MPKKSAYEQDAYWIALDIDEDRKRVRICLSSTFPMEDGDIILAIEDWLNNNLLEGFQGIAEGEH